MREGLTAMFDFEWVNANLLFGLFQRAGSYFDGSDLSARGVPASDAERALLAPYVDAVLPEVMDGTWEPPKSDGSGRDRAMIRGRPRAPRRGGLGASRTASCATRPASRCGSSSSP